jgi:IS30 family transposase
MNAWPGHWEGDLIKGARNRSQVGTLVERTTLFTVLAHMQDATALGAANAFSTVLNKVDAQMRLSLTYDQGRDMAAPPALDSHHRHAGVFCAPAQPLGARD